MDKGKKTVLLLLRELLNMELFLKNIEIVDQKAGFYLRTSGDTRSLMIMWPIGKEDVTYVSVEKTMKKIVISVPNLINEAGDVATSNKDHFVHTVFRVNGDVISKEIMAKPPLAGFVALSTNNKGVSSYHFEVVDDDLLRLNKLLNIAIGKLESRQENL